MELPEFGTLRARTDAEKSRAGRWMLISGPLAVLLAIPQVLVWNEFGEETVFARENESITKFLFYLALIPAGVFIHRLSVFVEDYEVENRADAVGGVVVFPWCVSVRMLGWVCMAGGVLSSLGYLGFNVGRW